MNNSLSAYCKCSRRLLFVNIKSHICKNTFTFAKILAREDLICEVRSYYIALDDSERRVVVNCLNEMRNKLIADSKYTDAVDEVLLKIIDTKQKKFKVIYKEA